METTDDGTLCSGLGPDPQLPHAWKPKTYEHKDQRTGKVVRVTVPGAEDDRCAVCGVPQAEHPAAPRKVN